jgi:hypothetical protein
MQASEQGAKGATIALCCYGAKNTSLQRYPGAGGGFESRKSQKKYGLCFNCSGTSLAVIHDLKNLILLRQKAERFSYDANGKHAWNSWV